MAKELPYFKFEPSEWTHGNIQMCSYEAKASFIELCCLYWNRLGDCSKNLSIALSCNRNQDVFNELVDCEIIQLKGDYVIINFLDIQLKEFKLIKKARAESGRKGGQKGGVRPIEERKKGNQIYIIECWNESERFYKIGTTSNCISRRYSGKIQYEYKLVFQHFTDEYIDAEKFICETLTNYEYKPKLNFAGQKECYLYSKYQHIESVFNNYFQFATASLKRTETRREEKRREEERKEKKITQKTLLSEIKISDLENVDVEYFEIAKAFQDLFIKNLEEKNAPTKNQKNASYISYVTPIRLMMTNDGISKEQLTKVFKYLDSPSGEFWKSNILSTKKLREKFEQLIIKSQQPNGKQAEHRTNKQIADDAFNSETAKNFRFS